MTASHSTVEAVYHAVRKHVTDEQMKLIVEELLRIDGNRSFCETIRRLAAVDAGASVRAKSSS